MAVFKGIKNFIANYDHKNKIHNRVVKMLIDNAVEDDEIAYYKKIAPKLVENKIKKFQNNFCKVERCEKKKESTFMEFDKIESYTENLNNIYNSEQQEQNSLIINKRKIENDEERKKIQIYSDSIIPGLGDDLVKNIETDTKIQIIKNNYHKKDLYNLNETPKNTNLKETEDIFNKNIYNVVNKILMYRLELENKPYYLFSPLQCKLCGLRYGSTSAEEFGIHIEDHMRRNRALDDKMVLQREFFTSKRPKTIIKLNLPCNEDIELIIWNKESPICTICNEIILKYWKDDIEEWVLENGVKINDYEYAHRKCVL